MSDQELIAKFLATRGVTRVPTGARSVDERDFYRGDSAMRNGKVMSTEDKAIAERHYVTGANGVEHCRNGLGEWIY